MALSSFQKEVLRVIARNRSADSYLAGAAVLNAGDERISEDFDIFHDAAEQVAAAWETDRAALVRAGFSLAPTPRSRPAEGLAEAVVSRGRDTVLLQWARDSAFRFFPVLPDPEWGFRLHDYDLAVNKALALAGRREPRDYYDVVALMRRGIPLAALAWAAPGKDPGFTPELLLDEMVRNSSYAPGELHAKVRVPGAIDVVELKRTFLAAVAAARDLFPSLPLEQAGMLYLDRQGLLCVPDHRGVEEGRLVLHAGSVGGAWPRVSLDAAPSAPAD